MDHRQPRTPRTVLALPNTGRNSVWTGRTVSGQSIHSVVAIPNRTVQLHFHCSDRIPPYTKSFENSQFEKISNFWYEYPMRHFGLMPDDLDNSNTPDHIPHNRPDILHFNRRPGAQNGGALPLIRPGRLFPAEPTVSYLRLSHAPTIGREMIYACPIIGNDLALSNLQVKSVLYTHHLSGTVDVLIIKLFVESSDSEFDNDHTNHYIRHRIFPNFRFDHPVLSRNHYNMGDPQQFISRNGMKNVDTHITLQCV